MANPAIQDYQRPADLLEALRQLRDLGPRAMALAGGTAVNAEPQPRIERVVDLAGLGLGAIAEEGPVWKLGAMVTVQQLIDSPLGREGFLGGALGEAARAMSGLNLRNRATLGGILATTDGISPLGCALLACDAELVLASLKGDAVEKRVLPLRAFLGYHASVLAGGSLITEVRLPIPSGDTRAAYERVARTPRDYPIVCAVARLAHKDGIAGNVRLALGGVAATPIRLDLAEFGLEKKAIRDHAAAAVEDGLRALSPQGDWMGSAEYRLAMAREMALRAIARCAA